MSDKMNANLKEKKSVIIAVLILVAIVIIGTTVGITQFKKQEATSGETTQTQTQDKKTETAEVAEGEAAEETATEEKASEKEDKKADKKADKKEQVKEEAKAEDKKADKKDAEKSDAKKETTQDTKVDFPDKKPAFLYFVSETDKDYEKAVKVFEELKKEYGEKVDFELKNVTQDPTLLENFALVNGNTPTLIMDGKEGITGFQMKMTDKKTLEDEIKKALK